MTAYSMAYRLVMVTGIYVQSLALGMSVQYLWLLSAISLIAVVTAMPFSLNALGLKEGQFDVVSS